MSETAYDPPAHQTSERENSTSHSGSSYGRFLAMVGTSTAIMFGLMYLNTYSIEHLYWSETRFYMTFVMGAVMAIVMLLFMWGMYKSMAANMAILAGSAAIFAGALWLVRSQETIQDESWMSAMIPHHSIAIMTSKRAEITDPRVKTLAEEIVVAQDREIAEMRYLLADIAANGEAGPDWPLGKSEGPAEVEGLQQAIATPVIAGIRPTPMKKEEVTRALGKKATCTFVRAVDAEPVLATDGSGNGVAKISGSLVSFEANSSISTGGVMTADGGRMTVAPGTGNDGEDATLLFELIGEQPLKVGFMGYWSCNA
ncbi:DUF305 domain-containing protein [Sulfitobacter mediterraneus]|uniref:DUF305 domain-containing protein n=2 Tax=Sulfitobacter mediterraneus TaxID=83219 RepID=UPI001931361C|nr:DUF305 domain-containing protein [Sulfitobacter mediterraneus]MBM1312146.1 DUF305 domain-containing protein [Sulfitobacter mediterraneus]MBM1316073.1 DUF305 domain-containing protein [Sulfitobacter mediterraneus]MBM1324387.1 DUF305 domain-containing protein [Sulfitobacter mediterraneus]MBM1328334.1 DUF305 domain-containing protein [Sulfitobacter mediterraneus]MBM1399637.1 DUF305 domain-containing protein [Sulfitobacter mediterraneus]